MILEPTMMNAGIMLPAPGYLEGLRELHQQHGALLTFDEVKTGLAVAPGGATEFFGVRPDIVASPRRSAAACRAGRSAAPTR